MAALLLVCAGCAEEAVNKSPEGAVRDLIERLESYEDERGARAIYELLSQRTRENLEARAERYGHASGKKIEPWAMLVPFRNGIRTVPHSYRARVVGDHALVTAFGPDGRELARIPCVVEDELWRVDLQLPPLPAMLRRPDVDR